MLDCSPFTMECIFYKNIEWLNVYFTFFHDEITEDTYMNDPQDITWHLHETNVSFIERSSISATQNLDWYSQDSTLCCVSVMQVESMACHSVIYSLMTVVLTVFQEDSLGGVQVNTVVIKEMFKENLYASRHSTWVQYCSILVNFFKIKAYTHTIRNTAQIQIIVP